MPSRPSEIGHAAEAAARRRFLPEHTAREFSSRGAFFRALRPERLPYLLHQPVVEFFWACARAGRATWALRRVVVLRDPQRGARRRRPTVWQRTHGRRAPVRTQHHRTGWGCRPLRAGLGNLAHAPDPIRRLGGPARLLRVVDIPVVLHYGHHERHLGAGDGVSFGLTCLMRGGARRGETPSGGIDRRCPATPSRLWHWDYFLE